MNNVLQSVSAALAPLWKQIKVLFSEHHFVTILCAFVALMMTISFYRFLKNISPALVAPSPPF
jgi:hypothetical protein